VSHKGKSNIELNLRNFDQNIQLGEIEDVPTPAPPLPCPVSATQRPVSVMLYEFIDTYAGH
jgi:hypothetical protein